MGKKLTTEQFIKRAIIKHGSKYDYSKAEYVNQNTKVCIICPEHGEFWQTPSNHLSGKGCYKCNGGVNIDGDAFIKKARELHGDKYDYSKVEYINSHTKVCIICSEHGEFWQTPSNHIHITNHRGCPKCAKNGVKLTNGDFTVKAKKVHGDKYDYSKVDYVDTHTKVCIICPEHGEFWQSPHGHLKGGGCPKCWEERKGQSLFSNTEEFIEKAKKVHGDKYDYSKVEYERSNKKVCIICPEHGEFWQTPNDHLTGGGCKECGRLSKALKKSLTNDDFIKRAKSIHGDKYDYSKADVYNRDDKGRVCIICPEHGEFWQTPANHLIGKGCEKCIRPIYNRGSFINFAKKTHGNKYDYSKVEYERSNKKVCIICPEHGEFWQTPSNHIQGQGCPKCNRSHLEREIALFLEENNIEYEDEKNFDWLGRQELDFYLPKYKVAIECQGLQHFRYRKHFSEMLEVIKERDERKRKLCNENGVRILYYSKLGIKYPYHVYEDKEELLKEVKSLK